MKFKELLKSELCVPQVKLDEITNEWNVIRPGKFCTWHKGTYMNAEVAVKKIKPINSDKHGEFSKEYNEIRMLLLLKHENIIGLSAFSFDGQTPCLAYPYMENGSLYDRLRNYKLSLSWLQRHEIARGILNGLLYLHCFGSKGVIHGAISSAHILLDEHVNPRIADFGLAEFEGSKCYVEKISRVQGVQPYLPNPHILKNNFSLKSDVYAYGIILFELVTGLSPYHNHQSIVSIILQDSDYKKVTDQRAGIENYELSNKLIEIGILCTPRIMYLVPNSKNVNFQFRNYKPRVTTIRKRSNLRTVQDNEKSLVKSV